jgi:hypothetical protein
VLARASEVTSVLIRGRVLSIGTVDHAGLGYCLLDPDPRYLLPYNIPSLGLESSACGELTDRWGGVVGEAGGGA